MKKVTIDDIAESANVSIKTVSRVFNHEPNVREKTREKVLEAARVLNYRPNISARTLASNKSYVVVHFYDNPNPDYVARIHQGLNKICRSSGYFAVTEPLHSQGTTYAEQISNYLLEFHIDGVLLSPPLCDDPETLSVLNAQNIPYVRLSPRYERLKSSCTFIDDEAGAKKITQHLIDLGHRNIAFVRGDIGHGATKMRQNGFLKAISEAGISEENCPRFEGDFSARSGFRACETLLNTDRNVTAIFAANDEMAVGAIMAALKFGLDVPGDISVVGFDGSRVGDIIWPPLTTIRQPVRGLAERATELLLQSIRFPSNEIVCEELPVELLSRGSSGSLLN